MLSISNNLDLFFKFSETKTFFYISQILMHSLHFIQMDKLRLLQSKLMYGIASKTIENTSVHPSIKCRRCDIVCRQNMILIDQLAAVAILKHALSVSPAKHTPAPKPWF